MAAPGGTSRPTVPRTPRTPKSTPRRPRKPRNQQQKKNNPQLTKHLLSLLSLAASAVQSFINQNDLQLLPSQFISIESLLSSLPFSLPPSSPTFSLPSAFFFYRFLASASSDFDPRWTHFFRMSKPTFDHLLSILSHLLLQSLPPSIPPDCALAATLFRLAHGASYSFVARRFGLDSPQAARLAFYTVCKSVNEELAHLVDFRKDLDQIMVGFGLVSLPNCCGVLGFGRFEVESEALGKNGSLLVQALVDSEGKFLDISAGWPCTMKPMSVFKQTKLYLCVEESRESLNGPCYELGEGISIPQYILGEPCFPVLPWLLTPYGERDGCDCGSIEREFNAAYGRVVGLVRAAFGRVKSRWQLLARRWKEDPVKFLPFVIVTGCLLHNYLIERNEPLPEESIAGWLKDEELPAFKGEVNEHGRRTRDALAKHLNRLASLNDTI